MIKSYDDFQRGCARETSTEELPCELLIQIFGDKLETLAKIALVSKRFKELAWDKSPLWNGFCNQCELGDVSPYPQTFMRALEVRNTKALLLFSELYKVGFHVKQNVEKAYDYLGSIVPITKEEEIDIRLSQVFIKIDFPELKKISDYQNYQLLVSTAQNPMLLTPEQVLRLDFGKALLTAYRGMNFLHTQKSVRILKAFSENPSTSSSDKIRADLGIARMYIKGQTNLVTADQVASLSLQNISKNQDIAEKQRIHADLIIAQLHIQKCLNSLTSSQTFQLLESISENENADWDHRFQAKFLMAIVRFKGPRDQVEDKLAVEMLQSIVQNPNACHGWRNKAEDLMAEFAAFLS